LSLAPCAAGQHKGVELVTEMPEVTENIMPGIEAEGGVGDQSVLSLPREANREVHLPKMGNYKMTRSFNSALCNVLLEYLAPGEGEKILDMGCNRGFYVREVAEHTDGVIGVDISESALRDPVSPRVRYGDVTNLDFEAESFDKIYSLHTIEHIPDLDLFLSEMARVLKPEGRVVLVYPWEQPFRGLQAMLASLRQYKNPFMGTRIHLHRLTPDRIQQLVEDTPLRHIESKFIFARGAQYISVLAKEK